MTAGGETSARHGAAPACSLGMRAAVARMQLTQGPHRLWAHCKTVDETELACKCVRPCLDHHEQGTRVDTTCSSAVALPVIFGPRSFQILLTRSEQQSFELSRNFFPRKPTTRARAWTFISI